MTSRSAGGERYNTSGRTVENVDISVNVLSPNVHLTIDGEKRMQHFKLTEASWLEISRLQLGEKRYAVCWAHTELAVHAFTNLTAHIRTVPEGFGQCSCGEPANLYFMEVRGKLDQPEMPPGSFERSQRAAEKPAQ